MIIGKCCDCFEVIKDSDARYESSRTNDGKFAPLGSGVKLCVGCGKWSHTGAFRRVEPERLTTSKGEVFYIDKVVAAA